MDLNRTKKQNSNKSKLLVNLKWTLALDHPLAILNNSTDLNDLSENDTDNVGHKKSLHHTRSVETKLVTTTWNGLDPLSAAISSSTIDELLAIQPDNNDGQLKHHRVSDRHSLFLGSDFQNWPSHRQKILNKFNTVEKLSIKSSFVFDKGTLNSTGVVGNTVITISTSNVSQKVKHRLEQLDELEEGTVNEMMNLSQQEYIKRIDEMNMALINAWESDQRVKALKIAIQCAKQLSSVNVMHFYPSKFVLITDILDNFGNLVYYRIEKKSTGASTLFGQKEDSNETCRNWFYKISSIRELLPRFYIECSVLRIYIFLMVQQTDGQELEYERIFMRLTKMIRGIGDPLVSIYCRVYLSRVVLVLFPEMKKIFLQNILDVIDNVNQLTCQSVQDCLQAQKIDYNLYYSLYQPALAWLFNCLFYKCPNSYHENSLKYFRNKLESFQNPDCSGFVLSAMINSLPSSYVGRNLLQLIAIIKNIYKNIDERSSPTAYPKYMLVKNIGDSLVKEDDFFRKYSIEKADIFDEFWTITKNLNLRHEYITCLETWSEIVAKYSLVNDINKFLGDIITNINMGKDFETFSGQLLQILTKIIVIGSQRIPYEQFFSMSNLLSYLDLFHKEDLKIDACKILVSSFNKNCSLLAEGDDEEDCSSASESGPDPVILNAMIYLCKLIHDSINSLTLDDEKRQISTLIIGFIRRVSFKRDLEARLNFYIESRANFSNLDQVLSFIVHQVNGLGMETHKLVNGHHTKKTISFVNACIAFSYITIPSIYDIILRLQLYLSSAHVALVNGCLPQTDAFLKLTITHLRQLPPYQESTDGKRYSNEEFLHFYTSQLLSTLIVVPDNPELGVLYLFKGLYNVLKEWKFEPNSNYRFMIWLTMIRYLSTCLLDNYPYHVDRVDSNDTLYAQDDEFTQEIHTYFDIIFQEMLDQFKKSQHDFDIRQQCNVSLELIHLVLKSGNADKLSHVINHLWNWTCKTQSKFNFNSLNAKLKHIYELLGKTFNTVANNKS